MAFSRENVSRIRAEFIERRHSVLAESERRKQEVYEKLPELRFMDCEISSIGLRVMDAALKGGDVEGALANMRKEHDALRARRAEILTAAGYSADYTDLHFRCDRCGDTGFVGTEMCACMRQELIRAGYESSGIAALMEKQSFDTFRLDYYTGAERESMRVNFETLYSFAYGFAARRSESYLLIGGTGLGKTHLSTAVARAVIDGGFDVVYDTAQGMFSVFEASRFGRSETDAAEEERYFSSDLLIIDDLGTEMTNQFTVSCLYNLINTRVNAGRSTIINTNLTSAELRARYADRITSRLFGEFRPLLFSGRDIRAQKLKAER